MPFGYNGVQQASFSLAINTSLPDVRLQRGEFIKSIVANIQNNSQIQWSAKVSETGTTHTLKPLTKEGLKAIVNMVAVSGNIPEKATILDLPNQLEVKDKSGALLSRITYNGTHEVPLISIPEQQSVESYGFPNTY
jgi:hypothetical protein